MGWIYHNKPPMGWPIDWDSPLPKDVVAYWPMNETGGSKIYDLSESGNAGTIVGADWVPGKHGLCLDFPGATDYVIVDKSLGLSVPYTISCWVKEASNLGTDSRYFMFYGDAAAASNYLVLMFDAADKIKAWSRNSVDAAIAITPIAYADGNWHHVTVVVKWGVGGIRVHVYVDGAWKVMSDSGSDQSANYNRFALGMERGTSPLSLFVGSLDNATVFNRELLPTEIAQLYREPFAMFASPELIFSPGGAVIYDETVNDSMGLTDVMTRTQVQARIVSESLGLIDSMGRTQVQVRTFAESLSLTDVDSKILVYMRTLAESLGLIDSVGRTQVQVRTETESLGLTDEDSKVSVYARTLAEAVGLTDVDSKVSAYARILSEVLGLTDSVGRTQVQARIIAESLGLTDDIALQRAFIIAEALELTDDMDRIQVQARIVADALGLTDDVILGRIITIADGLGITDAVTRLMDYLRVEEDDVDLIDSMSRVFSFLRTISDSEEISDSISYGELLSAIWAYVIMRQTHS